MSNIEATFRERTQNGETALIAYITCGDPNFKTTEQIVWDLEKVGVDILELGVPFSDPMADGPTIQKASDRAIKRGGASLKKIISFVKKLKKDGLKMPIVLFSYFNPIFHMGIDAFCTGARSAKLDGVLVVDLPLEEAAQWKEKVNAAGIDTIFLATPTTPTERLKLIGKFSTGFVYYVSRLGVTGARKDLPRDLKERLAMVRDLVEKPVAIGFGISTADQAKHIGKCADGVVIGSAFVEKIEKSSPSKARAEIKTLAESVVKVLHTSRRPGGGITKC